MKTSYFAKFSRLSNEEKEKYYPIAISQYLPKWFDLSVGEHIADVAPLKELVLRLKEGDVTHINFTVEYISLLNEFVDIDGFVRYLQEIENMTNKEVVLLCYEKSDDFCHRHLLRHYLNKRFDLDIKEL